MVFYVGKMSDLSTKRFKNIMVRMPNWIGDLVMATPILADLRQRYPEAKITVMVRTPLGELLQNDPHINEIFSFSKMNCFGWRDEKRDAIEKLRQGKYDLGVILTNSFSSAWWFWQGRVKNRIGFAANARRLLLSKAVAFPKERKTQHLVITYKKLLEPLGISCSSTAPRLYLTEEEIEHAHQLVAQNGVEPQQKIIGINPGAAYGSAKCWLPDRFRAVTQTFLDKTDAAILYFGDSTGAELIKEICRDFPERVINLAGATSLRELMSLLQICNVLLTNDSGPMHLGAALGIPVVALFGSTDAVVTGPYGNGIVLQKQVSCAPCFQRTCPIDFRCMKGISAEEVANAVLRLLEGHNDTHP